MKDSHFCLKNSCTFCVSCKMKFLFNKNNASCQIIKSNGCFREVGPIYPEASRDTVCSRRRQPGKGFQTGRAWGGREGPERVFQGAGLPSTLHPLTLSVLMSPRSGCILGTPARELHCPQKVEVLCQWLLPLSSQGSQGLPAPPSLPLLFSPGRGSQEPTCFGNLFHFGSQHLVTSTFQVPLFSRSFGVCSG